PDPRPQDEEERRGGERGAVERDLERWLGDLLDPQAPGGPEERGPQDQEDALTSGCHFFSTALTMARATASAAAAPTRSLVRIGGGGPEGESAKTTSPSRTVCAGRTARAIPSCASMATRFSEPCSKGTSVATQTRVVLAPACGLASRLSSISARASSHWSPCPRAPAIRRPVPGSTTSPNALPAASAAPRSPPGSSMDAPPTPPRDALATPRSFPTVAPPPAPTRPVVIGPSAAASQAASPEVSSGYAPDSPTPRSKRIAPGTIGTRAFPTAKPTPRRASHDMTPLAAATPKALPPAKTTAW